MSFTDIFIVLLCVVASSAKGRVFAQENCFTFNGDSYLEFLPDASFDNDNSAHYELEFKTNNPNGLLMYARGENHDMEALYVRGGHLHYHLFNSGSSGIGRQFGANFNSTERVDNNAWIKVHVYRSMEMASSSRHSQASEWKTGIEFELNGSLRSYVDRYPRNNIDLTNSIYFGGFPRPVSASVENFNFTGQIRGIKEHINNYVFENPNLNYRSRVELHCFGLQPQ